MSITYQVPPQPIKPPIPGIDLPGIFTVRTIPDSRRIREWIDAHKAKKVLLVGGGFIGLEMAENLLHRGMQVTLVEKADQLLPPLDPEVVAPVKTFIETKGVSVHLGDAVKSFSTEDGRIEAITEKGASIKTDLVILAIGLRPETSLAKAAGLTLAASGAIVVSDGMQTSDAHIWAVGDAVESTEVVTGTKMVLALAGPANRCAPRTYNAHSQAHTPTAQQTALRFVHSLTPP